MAAPKETNRSEYKLPYSLSLTWASSTALFFRRSGLACF